MSDTKIQWHPGFVSAMDLELRENRTDLVYEREYNLNTKPLEIDLLVIKKDKNVQMINEIGKLFRGHNIMEYKSPEDGLNIDTFYKSGAYASLYKSYGETVDKRTADGITVSGDGNMCQALLEIMEPEIMKIKEEVRQETRQETILCAVEGFRDLGTSDDKIREILKKKYGFSDEEADEYL